jgi:type IV secretion system protein VirB1
MLPPALFAPLAAASAAQVAPGTLAAMAVTESGFDPLTIRDNTAHMARRLRDSRKALLLAEDLIGAGRRLDLGLMELDSTDLARLHVTLSQAFEPCASLHAARTILVGDVLGPCG